MDSINSAGGVAGMEQCVDRFGKLEIPPVAVLVFCVASSSLHLIHCPFGKVCPCLLLYFPE